MRDYSAQLGAMAAQGKPAEKKVVQDKKFPKEVLMTKYFNPIVDKAKGQTAASFTFRILPTEDDSSPFKEVKVHTGLKVNGKWQKFTCLSEFGQACPLCETEKGLKDSGKEDDKETAKSYRASDFYIVKGIDRAKESEGVKYWRFKRKFDGTGVFDKIKTLADLFGNILLPDEGYDLYISCTLDTKGNSVISSINCVKPSPLAKTEEQMELWLSEDSTWKDVFREKTTQYLVDVINGVAPYWDDVQKKYINPAQTNKEQATTVQSNTISNSVEANSLLVGESFDGSEVDDSDLPF